MNPSPVLAEIISGYSTRFGDLFDQSLEDLIVSAATGCFVNSTVPLKWSQIDMVVIASMTASFLQQQGHLPSLVTQLLPIKCPVISVDAACAGGASALGVALNYLASTSSQRQILVIGVEKLTDFDSRLVGQAMMHAASASEESSIGLTFPAINALVAAAYLWKYHLDRSVLSAVSIKNHYHGSLNPLAHFKKVITLSDYLKSEMVSSPLCLYDCSPISDGASAVIVSNGHHPKTAKIVGFSQTQDLISLHHRPNISRLPAMASGFKNILKQSKISKDKISLMELHDAFTILEFLSLEEMGFYPLGQASKGYNNKDHYLSGRLPINVSGGLKACGHPVSATGIRQIVDLNQQLTYRSGPRQVKNCNFGLAQNLGGIAGTCVYTLIASP